MPWESGLSAWLYPPSAPRTPAAWPGVTLSILAQRSSWRAVAVAAESLRRCQVARWWWIGAQLQVQGVGWHSTRQVGGGRWGLQLEKSTGRTALHRPSATPMHTYRWLFELLLVEPLLELSDPRNETGDEHIMLSRGPHIVTGLRGKRRWSRELHPSASAALRSAVSGIGKKEQGCCYRIAIFHPRK